MSRIKGCTNEECAAYKKISFRDSEQFCSRCGQPLVYVCKKCHKPLASEGTLCAHCQAEKDDRNERAKKWVVWVGGAAVAVGAVVVKKGFEVVKKVHH